jgi:hypothetical protein
MKKITSILKKYNKGMRITAALLIGCMLFADASLYLSITFDNLPYTNKIGDSADASGNDFVVYENHLLDVAMADGEYNGNNSDSENAQESIIESSEGKRLFNILEIVPTEKKGVIGYLIGGCEPFSEAKGLKSGETYIVTPQQMRAAYMDAIVNKNPGSSNANDGNNLANNNISKMVWEMNSKFAEGGNNSAFTFESGKTYSGYYKYVGGNKGVFRLQSKSGNNAVMQSRFYYGSGNTDYNYIFVYSDSMSSDADDINVSNHKRIKYTNNEKFITDFLGHSDAQSWKENHVCQVVTRTPAHASLEDIEAADIIFINNGDQMDYYKFAARLKNMLNGENEQNNVNDKFSDSIDFDNFEKVLKIYERVVVREDVAIVVEKLVCPNSTNNGFTTNMHKLMCMLFYVNKGNEKFAGRDIFTDYLKRYTSEPGTEYMELRRLHEEDPVKYPTDYRAISLRSTDDKSNPSYYYMHSHHWAHVGHPLVLSEDEAITGGYFDSEGILQPTYHDSNYLHPITLKRLDTRMFNDAGIDYKEETVKVKDTSKYYSKSPWWNGYDQDPNGDYIKIDGYWDSSRNVWVNEHYELAGDTVITKDEKLYYHEGAYESMSNTTDFVYIANDGTLVIDDKYSSKNGYWFCIDYDGNVGDGFAFRRRLWDRQEYSTWPWDYNMSVWFMKRKDETPNSYDCNMHMWYDYNAFRGDSDRYTAHTGDSPFNHTYKNETLMEENAMMKGTWIKDALAGREIKREETDDTHVVEKAKKDYYISMNILNGDGVNKNGLPGSNNKTLYYNQYEKDDIQSYETANGKARIPINIRIKSSCKLLNIKVYDGSTGSVIATYPLNIEVTNENEINSSGGRGLKLTRPASSLDDSGKPKDKTSGDGTMIHTFEGSIYDVMSSYYLNKRNEKIIVELNAEAPDGSTKSIQDTITIVKRDFFMLD